MLQAIDPSFSTRESGANRLCCGSVVPLTIVEGTGLIVALTEKEVHVLIALVQVEGKWFQVV
jgi:hypothetical protein